MQNYLLTTLVTNQHTQQLTIYHFSAQCQCYKGQEERLLPMQNVSDWMIMERLEFDSKVSLGNEYH